MEPWNWLKMFPAITLEGEHLEDDESSFEVAVFKGPAEPMFWREPQNP